jgi:pimeloyl-ACP methyl ester carboxylesterase
MNTFTTKDGTSIYYKDWGEGQPVVFSHGWPLNADAWDPQMIFLGQHGFRVIAHDRRSHGRSQQTWKGNDMDTYADDLAELFERLDLANAVIVGHSTGGGEVARYIGRHGTKRVAKAVLISAVVPIMVESVLTIVGGKAVYGAEEFEDMAPPLPPVLPDWSPVAAHGGYARRVHGAVASISCIGHSHKHETGGFGCLCWAF